MTRFDDILIERVFSPLAGWLEHRLGFGRWPAALECLNGHVAFYLAAIALTLARKGPKDGIFADLLAGLFWLAIIEAARRAARRQAASPMGVQSARLGEWHFRAIFLLMLPFSAASAESLAGACYAASLALLVVHLYLKASDVPPPRARRSLALGSA